MEYPGQPLIDKADAVFKKIYEESAKKFVEELQLAVMPRDKFFPRFIKDLGMKQGVEIGVDTGAFSKHILEGSDITLTCVDTWMDDYGSDYEKVDFNKSGDNRLNHAIEYLRKYIESDRAILKRMTGMQAAEQQPDDSLDFCYIDGDHTLGGVYDDITAWMPKVRVGGIISGHDYKDDGDCGMPDYFGKQLPYGVKQVVDYYTTRYGHALRLVGGVTKNWWFVKN